MKNLTKWILIISVVLVLLDVGTKFIIENLYSYDGDLMQVRNCIHLHPRVNTEKLSAFTAKEAAGGLPISVSFALEITISSLIAAMIVLLFSGMHSILCTVKYPMPVLTGIVISLTIASHICVSLDYILRRGSLDWICICGLNTETAKIWHMTVDLKDIYLYALLLVVLIYVIRFELGLTNKSFRQNLEQYFKEKRKRFNARVANRTEE